MASVGFGMFASFGPAPMWGHQHCHAPRGFDPCCRPGYSDGYQGYGRENYGFHNSQEGIGWGNSQYSNGSWNNSYNGGNWDHTSQTGRNNQARNYGSHDSINQWGGNNVAQNNGWGDRISEQGWNNQVINNGNYNDTNVRGNNQNIEVCGSGYNVTDDNGHITATDKFGRNRADDAQKGQDNRIHVEKNPINGRTYIGSQREIDAAERREGVYRGEPSKGKAGGGLFGGATNQLDVGRNNQLPGYHPGGMFGPCC